LMEQIIISLKEKYFEQIRNGEKHFEYRKSFKKIKGAVKAYIYVSKPVAKIYSYVILNEGVYDTIPNILRNIVSKDQPDMIEEIREYLQGSKKNKKNGIALPIVEYKEFEPQNLSFLRKRFGFQPSPTWIEDAEYPEMFDYLKSLS
ncbi:MAG: hypothetical protein SO314_05780, partial [Alphaproteobacteria bacterium]|nr:hypothetical protein [Alphaproteobacteria bacterium]